MAKRNTTKSHVAGQDVEGSNPSLSSRKTASNFRQLRRQGRPPAARVTRRARTAAGAAAPRELRIDESAEYRQDPAEAVTLAELPAVPEAPEPVAIEVKWPGFGWAAGVLLGLDDKGRLKGRVMAGEPLRMVDVFLEDGKVSHGADGRPWTWTRGFEWRQTQDRPSSEFPDFIPGLAKFCAQCDGRPAAIDAAYELEERLKDWWDEVAPPDAATIALWQRFETAAAKVLRRLSGTEDAPGLMGGGLAEIAHTGQRGFALWQAMTVFLARLAG